MADGTTYSRPQVFWSENVTTNSLAGRYTLQQALVALLHGAILFGGLTESGVITGSRTPPSKNTGNQMISEKTRTPFFWERGDSNINDKVMVWRKVK